MKVTQHLFAVFLGFFLGLFEISIASFLPAPWGAFHPLLPVSVFLLLRGRRPLAFVVCIAGGIVLDLFAAGSSSFATANAVLVLGLLSFLGETVVTNQSWYAAAALMLVARAAEWGLKLPFGLIPSWTSAWQTSAWDIAILTILLVARAWIRRRFVSSASDRPRANVFFPYGH